MIKCPNCGEELVAGTIYCSNCGGLVGEKPKPEVIIDEDSVKKAYFEGMVEVFKFIIIPVKEEYWSSDEELLISAVKYKNKDILKAMLKAGFYPLHSAAEHENEALLNAVLEMDLANIDQVDTDGNTALMIAAGRGNNKIVKILIDAGADVNKTNKDNENALAFARRRSNSYTVRILHQAGAVDN